MPVSIWHAKLASGILFKLDDDYSGFYFRFNRNAEYGVWPAKFLDEIFAAMVQFLIDVPQVSSICTSQGGDHIGGKQGAFASASTLTRKAMNTFICDVERQFVFQGRVNEDVTTYVLNGGRGQLFFTATGVQGNQKQTQANAGGMTDIYRDGGTYRKSFYTVMQAPSCVRVAEIGTRHRRIHHWIDWPRAVPVILREDHKKRPGQNPGR